MSYELNKEYVLFYAAQEGSDWEHWNYTKEELQSVLDSINKDGCFIAPKAGDSTVIVFPVCYRIAKYETPITVTMNEKDGDTFRAGKVTIPGSWRRNGWDELAEQRKAIATHLEDAERRRKIRQAEKAAFAKHDAIEQKIINNETLTQEDLKEFEK